MHPTKASTSLIYYFFSFFVVSFFATQATAATHNGGEPSSLVRRSCTHARYSDLCLRTLASAKTPADLAKAAVSVSLARARKATAYLAGIRSGGSKKEKGAVEDCVEELSESVEQLRRTLKELRALRPGTFRWQMSNAETWVSAALTNENTCLDGFEEVAGGVKSAVKKKIVNVAQLTSNALYTINLLASNQP